MRRTSFALFVTAVGASLFLSSSDAAPISRSPSSQTKHQQEKEAVVPGRIQIKSKSRLPASSPSASASSSSTSSHKHKHKHNHKKSNKNKKHSSSPLDKFLIPDPELSGSAWYPVQHRTRNRHVRALVPEGHAVIDDEDDDAGNELLDTELDSGLERPDDDDTIEGQILEEEDLDDFDTVADDGDEDGVEGHLLQHTLRAANTAANVARAKAAALTAAARARAVESLDWLKESELEFEDAEGDEVGEKEVVKVVLSRFGGRAAAADMAAHAGEV
ncbi:hypothetical protein BG015_008690 [Linnemannia schmuckeri]|uniref:Uncharacterized protein n=1 Tax=Linnemannia schmuckeri TaxID=64567 RepID=A0A9P5S6C8_9FUNG|nr:hypothetical protein BG015_008690 [Linnemannia schmuckeri]